MSRTNLLRLLAVLLLAGGVAWSGRAALAGATSLDDLLSGALAPSSAPALLGPITSAGRIGWECKPERAAAAAPWRQAELPSDAGSP
ncbi:MAG: hypothetical protein JO146_06830 [Candidatus Eremiobacteraeota bacterium]|nr:hypothetical protein [Candidatus Eremiobacteraeota bacterium]